MITSQTPVWFITGCSTGFGRELAIAVLGRGWRCVATARNVDSLADLAAPGSDAGDRLLRVALDVTDAGQIRKAVDAAHERFGYVDVLVNNAGYGYQSSVEEGEEHEIRAQFETNVFGLFSVTRAVLPGMRIRRKGHVINVTSVGGLMGFAGAGYYVATKHAIEGWSDSLALETKHLGIRVTCVEPGSFRTDWAGRSLKQTPVLIDDYAETAGKRLQMTVGYSGQQPGDPARAAQAMIRISESGEQAPRHLVLGAFGVDAVTERLRATLEDIDRWRGTSIAADFPLNAQ
jgi:NAD(P)-dependent dehydrogenase (short-subunit alcohol dehydrogenase family)